MKLFEIDALLHVLLMTESHKRVPVAIGSSITDMAIDSLGTSDFNHTLQSWKTVHCATKTNRHVQIQQLQNDIIETMKSIKLLPLSTTAVYGFT